MKDKDGKRIAQGISYKYFQVIQRFDGYTYRREGMNIA
ncbi:hypothetical protein TAF16_1035 [Anoxybacillus flavithermus]|uniref:Uncharacterized protein n=1 Tax=Anoxybacillus flavithermus TaxID=33934 RepID=A0A178TFS3_9BACL|nr:hypothetical protein TAF16_1035 [Anoxybacillus flavithermus]